MAGNTTLPRVAYFCMEFGLDSRFPIYAGGLGILAGDILKTAKDMRVPLVGIGILWREGYTMQTIGDNYWPLDSFMEYERDFLEDTGVVVTVKIKGADVPCRVWRTESFGNAPLYLLDCNVEGSSFGWITDRLYGGGSEERVAQEIVLGIGGIRALRALGLDMDIYHFNEGHAVLAGIELIRELMAQGAGFQEAWEETRNRVIFTTHTPVMAGNEYHDHNLLYYMGAYNTLDYYQMEQIGGNPFGMTVAGLRLSYLSNGVAKLHGVTARSMWEDICGASPIISITNGVHAGTWQDRRILAAFKTGSGLWEAHIAAKKDLLAYIRKKTGREFDLDKLLIGFARRAAPYKRSDLIFRKPEVIESLLSSGSIQLVFAGKAHPKDEIGKGIVSNLVKMAEKFRDSVVFLENYDMDIGRLLTSGCDLWLNNPQRPLEASGTSGMKAAMNGVLNFSILDGWWPEACRHGYNGWRIGDGYEGPHQTEVDLVSLYDVLINEIIPTYYNNRDKWLKMMNESIAMSSVLFSSERMLTEYYNLLYLPTRAARLSRSELLQV